MSFYVRNIYNYFIVPNKYKLKFFFQTFQIYVF